MQRATINSFKYDESQVLGATNDTTPQNNSLGGPLPQKLILDVKALECQYWIHTYVVSKIDII